MGSIGTSINEWRVEIGFYCTISRRDTLTGFDRLRQAKIIEGLRERSLAEFYREVVDNVYASSLISDLLESTGPEQEGKRLARPHRERIRRDLIECGLNVRMAEHRLLLAYARR